MQEKWLVKDTPGSRPEVSRLTAKGDLSLMAGEITITDRAAEKIRKLLVGAKAGTRACAFRVVEGGCSGFEYKMDIDSPESEDQVFEKHGARVLLGAKSLLHLERHRARLQRRVDAIGIRV